jgi:DNA-binding response OmpR family regulator
MAKENKEKLSSLKRKFVVLFVDDSRLDRTYIEGILTQNNIEVILAENGDEAMKFSKDRKPDLILLDILLPKVSGIEVCKRMKADNDINKIPVIFFTSIDTPKGLINYAGYGAVDYLHKSIPPEILVEQILSAIEASQKQ